MSTWQGTCQPTTGTMQITATAYTAVDTRGLSESGRFHWIMASIVSGCLALGYAVAPLDQIIDPAVIPGCLSLAAAVGFFGWLGYERVYNALSVCFWSLVFLLCIGSLLYAAGSSPYPLMDSTLARYDVVSTGAIVRWLETHMLARRVSVIVYSSLNPLTLAALVIPCLCRRYHNARRLVIASAVGCLIAIAVFALLPAAGPWTVEGYRPAAFQTQVSAQITSLKAHRVNGLLQTYSIVSFPSYHTVLALLCAIALWPIRWCRWPAVVLATGICVSTVTTGWHYGIDVIAGAAVALMAQAIANRIIR